MGAVSPDPLILGDLGGGDPGSSGLGPWQQWFGSCPACPAFGTCLTTGCVLRSGCSSCTITLTSVSSAIVHKGTLSVLSHIPGPIHRPRIVAVEEDLTGPYSTQRFSLSCESR